MSKIEEMIRELCPNGVERVPIGKIIEYLPGGSLTRDQVEEKGTYSVMNGGMDYSGFYNNFNYDEKVLTISHWGSSAGHVHRHFSRFWANNACWVFVPRNQANCLLIYLYYALKDKERAMAEKFCFGGATPNLNRQLFEKIRIPLPPLAIQQEIVSVLDSFTTLIDKMKKEVEMRKKQMEEYREKLICGQNYEKKSIKNLGTLERGSGLQKKDFTDNGVGCIHYGQIYTRLSSSCKETLTYVSTTLAKKLTVVHPGNLVIACTSENVEDVCKSVVWLGEEDIVTGGHTCVFRHKENPKYISYCFQTADFALQKIQYAYGAKVIDIRTEKLGLIELPVPPLPVQQEIVRTLDTFETNISKMERLIALRQKQYEYYREKLLTFE